MASRSTEHLATCESMSTGAKFSHAALSAMAPDLTNPTSSSTICSEVQHFRRFLNFACLSRGFDNLGVPTLNDICCAESDDDLGAVDVVFSLVDDWECLAFV
ncbi:unnamed protein product [Chondrus crispus]|uniref:Uncharacterized protein n=1 Tax=Chondrus crispus TaxID=2769 RepID=R7Q7A0_CHOCR|nr:unnamed protein product [Chondrus crispus]CDF33703.1 unnamed protein product [Chondrus crispus]|eukprot:XP_005713522.1 unnamed protein product [Chondrus crispus]